MSAGRPSKGPVHLTTVKIKLNLYNDLSCFLEDMSLNDVVELGIIEFLSRRKAEYCNKKIREAEAEKDFYEKQKSMINQKNESFINIPWEEVLFLMEAKRRILADRNYLKGLKNQYLNEFGKLYSLSDKEFEKLITQAQEQHEERQTLETMKIKKKEIEEKEKKKKAEKEKIKQNEQQKKVWNEIKEYAMKNYGLDYKRNYEIMISLGREFDKPQNVFDQEKIDEFLQKNGVEKNNIQPKKYKKTRIEKVSEPKFEKNKELVMMR